MSFCSFIVPIYNSEAYLKKCVDSILNQSAGDFELILVNDGSTDRSGAICQHYAEKDGRVRLIEKENGGHTSARNAGLQVATGKYIAFVDSDDWVDLNLVADCMSAAQQDEDVILFGYRRVRGSVTEDKPQPYPPGTYNRQQMEEAILPKLLTSGHFSLSERMIRRELVMQYQCGVDPRILVGEDLVCCTQTLFHARGVAVLPGVYYNYLQRQGSMIHSYKNYTFENWDLIRQQLRQLQMDGLQDFDRQLGRCSIRLLQQAVLGEFERSGLGLKTRNRISTVLKNGAFSEDIRNAQISPRRPAVWFKWFCLRYRLVYLLYFTHRTQERLRNHCR